MRVAVFSPRAGENDGFAAHVDSSFGFELGISLKNELQIVAGIALDERLGKGTAPNKRMRRSRLWSAAPG